MTKDRTATSESQTAEPEITRSAAGEIEIEATPEEVWKALTEAKELERWFPLEARVEPREGGTYFMSWKNEFEGDSEILVWDPPRHLRTSWEWGASITDYTIEARGGRTYLRAVTSGFSMDPEWDEWVEGTVRGWAYELASLKHYLERHVGEDRDVIYLRRAIEMPLDEAWAKLTGSDGLPVDWADGGTVDISPPRQRAGVVSLPRDGLARLSVEHAHNEEGGFEVNLFLSAWGAARTEVSELRETWMRELDRLFPGGETKSV